jgi:TP901 family phage tail tape measure protein
MSLSSILNKTPNFLQEVLSSVGSSIEIFNALKAKEKDIRRANNIFGRGISLLKENDEISITDAFKIGKTLREASKNTSQTLEQLFEIANKGIENGISKNIIGKTVEEAGKFSTAFGIEEQEDVENISQIIGNSLFQGDKELDIQGFFNDISIASKKTKVAGKKIIETFGAIKNPEKYGSFLGDIAALTTIFIDDGENAENSARQTEQFINALTSGNLASNKSKKAFKQLGLNSQKFAKKMAKNKTQAITEFLRKLKQFEGSKPELIENLFGIKDENFVDNVLGMIKGEKRGNILRRLGNTPNSFLNRLDDKINFSDTVLENQDISQNIMLETVQSAFGLPEELLQTNVDKLPTTNNQSSFGNFFTNVINESLEFTGWVDLPNAIPLEKIEQQRLAEHKEAENEFKELTEKLRKDPTPINQQAFMLALNHKRSLEEKLRKINRTKSNQRLRTENSEKIVPGNIIKNKKVDKSDPVVGKIQKKKETATKPWKVVKKKEIATKPWRVEQKSEKLQDHTNVVDINSKRATSNSSQTPQTVASGSNVYNFHVNIYSNTDNPTEFAKDFVIAVEKERRAYLGDYEEASGH